LQIKRSQVQILVPPSKLWQTGCFIPCPNSVLNASSSTFRIKRSVSLCPSFAIEQTANTGRVLQPETNSTQEISPISRNPLNLTRSPPPAHKHACSCSVHPVQVRMAERSKAPDSRRCTFLSRGISGLRMEAWVRIPLLTWPLDRESTRLN